jgi:hypothetical protein
MKISKLPNGFIYIFEMTDVFLSSIITGAFVILEENTLLIFKIEGLGPRFH